LKEKKGQKQKIAKDLSKERCLIFPKMNFKVSFALDKKFLLIKSQNSQSQLRKKFRRNFPELDLKVVPDGIYMTHLG